MAELWRLLREHRGLAAVCLISVIVNRLSALAAPAAVGVVLDAVTGRRGTGPLPRIIGLVAAATAVQMASQFGLGLLAGRAGQRVIARMQMQVHRHVLDLPVAFHENRSQGALASRITRDAGGLRVLFDIGAADIFGAGLTALVVLALLLRLSVAVTVPVVGALTALALLSHGYAGRLRPIFVARSSLEARVTGRLTESLAGVRVVKGYGSEARESAVFARGARRLAELGMETQVALARLNLVTITMTLVTGPLVLSRVARAVTAGRRSGGGCGSVLALLGYAAAAARQLGGARAEFAEGMAALDRTGDLLAERRESDDARRTETLDAMRGEIRFEQVSFAYEPGRPVLRGISFTARPGEVTALVGSSGGGKSTILALVCGFRSAGAGTVTVDGVDAATLRLGSLRRGLGLVTQEPLLFSGSIRENVLFGRENISEQAFRGACHQAHVEEIAARFPLGFETEVGERGVRLSGGQQQRICLARAIAGDPRLLALDEATSSLDSESEALIQDSLRTVMQGRTTIVIAHRLSTIREADQILVVEGGEIVERGTHTALLARKGRYFTLHQSQHPAEQQADGARAARTA